MPRMDPEFYKYQQEDKTMYGSIMRMWNPVAAKITASIFGTVIMLVLGGIFIHPMVLLLPVACIPVVGLVFLVYMTVRLIMED